MRRNRFQVVLAIAVAMAGVVLTTTATGTVITGTAGGPNGSHDTWNNAANWDAGIPSGAVNAVVNTGVMAQCWNSATPVYTGSLTLLDNSTLQMGWTTSYPASANALGGSGVTMNNGTEIRLRLPFTVTLPAITMAGNGQIHLSPSTSAHHKTRNFDGVITGAGNLTVVGNNNNTAHLNAANPTWSGGFIADSNAGWRVEANQSGAFGTGDVTFNNAATLQIDAADVIGDAATLSLNGAKDSRKTAKLILNANDIVGGFWIDTVNQGYGDFSAATHPGIIGGTGTLSVPVPSVPDFDGDGFNAGAGPGDDWNDGDATIYPGAPELPDLKDNNQNSLVDDGLTPINTMNTDGGGDISWLLGSNWSLAHMPGANDSAIVSAGLTAQVTSLPSGFDYAGTLTLNDNATLRINNTGGDTNLDALGEGGITLHDGSTISTATASDPHFPGIELAGDATTNNPTNATHHDSRFFDGPITGPGSLTIVGNNNITYHFNAAGDFSGGLIADGGGWRIEANVPGSLGAGDVTINNGVSLIIDAADAMDDLATLFLNGGKDSRRDSKLIMNADDTIMALWIDGLDQGTGLFTDASGAWISGNGILTVTGAIAVVPEPSTFVLAALGLLGLAFFARRRRRLP